MSIEQILEERLLPEIRAGIEKRVRAAVNEIVSQAELIGITKELFGALQHARSNDELPLISEALRSRLLALSQGRIEEHARVELHNAILSAVAEHAPSAGVMVVGGQAVLR